MAQTGPTPDTRDCHTCRVPISWLWSPRVNRGLGGWTMYERVSDDGYTIRSHRCKPPRGEFDYHGSEDPPVAPKEYAVGDTVTVGGIVFTKIGEDPFGGSR